MLKTSKGIQKIMVTNSAGSEQPLPPILAMWIAMSAHGLTTLSKTCAEDLNGAAAVRARRELIAFAPGLGTSIPSQSVRGDEGTDMNLVRSLVNSMEPSSRATQPAAAL